jgi:hypothetical protein
MKKHEYTKLMTIMNNLHLLYNELAFISFRSDIQE